MAYQCLCRAQTYRLEGCVGSVLGRSDGETTTCPECATNEPGSNYQVRTMKQPQHASLPLTIKFVVDPGQTIGAEPELCIGGHTYKFMSVVFGNGVHFKCNVVLNDTWYHYDGMGMPSLEQDASDFPLIPRMARIDRNLDTHMTPPPPASGYTPISYRYVRKNAGHLQPVEIHDSEVEFIPQEQQFTSMWRLLVNGY
jgi:hypothetical protein